MGQELLLQEGENSSAGEILFLVCQWLREAYMDTQT